MIQVVVDTLTRASALSLLAVGLTLTFGAVKFPNVANTEFATFGAYACLLCMTTAGVGLIPAAVVSVVLVGLGAVLVYRGLLRRLIARSPALALIGSFALSVILRALLQAIAGPEPRQLDLPLERGVDVAGVPVTPSQIRIVVATAVVLAALMLMLRLTSLGRRIRAVSTNPQLAAAAGLNVNRVIDVVWLISGALGALAGVFLAIQTQASIDMGFALLIPVFAVAVLGGLGSPGGAILAAVGLALLESLVLKIDFGHLVGGGAAFVPVDYRAAVGFVLLVILLLYRPQGLMGREVRRG